MSITEKLKCPVCGRDMESDGKSLFCTGGLRRHLFDFASSGYVNLLPPGKKNNARSGDDKSMISARERFLDRGHYSRISEEIGKTISEIAENQRKTEIALADCASGEGYHTCNMIKTVAENGFDTCAAAFEASKYGTKRGAKRARRSSLSDKAFFAAANIFMLPVKDSSFDFATSLFAPIASSEMKRILKPEGKLIVASSGEDHLFELRRAIYDEPRKASGEVRCPEGFVLDSERTVRYMISLTEKSEIADLFLMTPFCYKTSKRDAEKLDSLDALDVTVEVRLSVFSPA